ncbi:MAG: hypothetical protein ACFFDN_00470 [Candidatus Hodarchaeota archaeon]
MELEEFLEKYEIAKKSVNLFLKYLQMCFEARKFLRPYYKYNGETLYLYIRNVSYESLGAITQYGAFRDKVRTIERFLREKELLFEKDITEVTEALFYGDEFDRSEENEKKDQRNIIRYIWIPTLNQLKELIQTLLNLDKKDARETYTKWISKKRKGRSKKSEEINQLSFLMKKAFDVKWSKPYYCSAEWLYKNENYKINDFLEIKLEDNHTNLYVNGKRFNQCHFLLLNVPMDNDPESKEIESIDEAKDLYSTQHEGNKRVLEPRVEFWGHCSNLQAWYEHGYDTRLLHSNLSFPLLKQLAEVGDPLAKKVYKEEIALRLESNYYPVVKYLVNNGYLDIFTLEELLTLRETLKNKLCTDINLKLNNLIEEKIEASILREEVKKNINKAIDVLERAEKHGLSYLNEALEFLLETIKEKRD